MVYLTSWATIGQWGGNRWCERGGRWSEGLQRLVKEGRLGGKAGWDYRHKRINWCERVVIAFLALKRLSPKRTTDDETEAIEELVAMTMLLGTFLSRAWIFFQSGSLSFLSPTACCWGWEAPIGLPPATTIFVFGNFSDQNLTFLFLLSKFEIIISHFSFYSRNSRSEFQISLSTNLLFWLSSMPYYGLPIYLQKSFISIQDTGHMRGGHTAWAPKGCGLKKVPEVGVQRAPKLLYDIWSWEYVTICVRQLQFLSRENLIFYCSKSQLCLSGDIINRTMWVGGGGEGEGGVVGHVQPVNSCQMGSLRLLGGNNIPSRTSRG